ncbi:methylated-DNA--[protein]-cysteine S-methyltransferase [Ramlibacter solisilvae]|uniref:Cysteine methyltransferase n=1 Tax=Ramlibacter tataouinensis TaxID=94132 RepID=A0A127JYQ6_9BURK|nr:methylated-DNA--[protein]-cysteine S-methyltransferase [Ramlibacter tataouinensis]AMO25069.1 cysteine methyltransferase [Ramlibacter tataouinensis]
MRAAGLCTFDTPIGSCGIAWSEDAIVSVQLPDVDPAATLVRLRRRHPGFDTAAAPGWVQAIIARIQALLAGGRDDLADVPLDMRGEPEFNQRVYAIARAIPPGRTLTYGEVAQRIGEPGAARAVGQALGHNPFAPVVPCHRVLAAGNAGGGFSATGGVATKLRMLQIERAQIGDEPGLFD